MLSRKKNVQAKDEMGSVDSGHEIAGNNIMKYQS
jgi:hypothetical protein